MPKAKNKLSTEKQRKRFEAEVQRLIEAGELNPTEADAALDKVVRKAVAEKQHPSGEAP